MLTDESPKAAVKKHLPPQAIGESAKQNCLMQRSVICVVLLFDAAADAGADAGAMAGA